LNGFNDKASVKSSPKKGAKKRLKKEKKFLKFAETEGGREQYSAISSFYVSFHVIFVTFTTTSCILMIRLLFFLLFLVCRNFTIFSFKESVQLL
jgi:hypothetical protein